MRRVVMWLRDYFVYKDMYNPSRDGRRQLLQMGRPGQDGFLLLAKALEERALTLASRRPGRDELRAQKTTRWWESGWKL